MPADDDSDEDEYVFYGTPLRDEGDVAATASTARTRVDPGTTRALPVHLQEPKDDQGRKRFHGAFTGGFSAGYYNTVGSKEGWTPGAFSSSRSAPAQRQQQSVEMFLDEDELEERRKAGLTLRPGYDTFGAAAAEAARAEAAAAAAARPTALPGAAPLEAFAPVASGIGVALLQKMGWRQGRGVGTARSRPTPRNDADSGNADQCAAESSSRWGTIGGVGVDNTPMHVLRPKQDVHGLGYDPFEGAEEFRERKRTALAASRAATDGTGGGSGGSGSGFGGRGGGGVAAAASRVRGVAFGTGVLQDDGDAALMGVADDYVDGDAEALSASRGRRSEVFAYEEASESDDEDRFDPRRAAPAAARIAAAAHGVGGAGGGQPPLQLTGSDAATRHGSFIPGFTSADDVERLPEFPLPQVPDWFVAFHSFPVDATDMSSSSSSAPQTAVRPAITAGQASAAAGPSLPLLLPPPPLQQQQQERDGPLQGEVLAAARAAAVAAAAAATAAAAAAHGRPDAAVAAAAAAAAAQQQHHQMQQQLLSQGRQDGTAAVHPSEPPPPAEPPADANLARQIEMLAGQVVRSGPAVERIAAQQAARRPGRYSFLVGGPGAEYYAWRLHQLKQQQQQQSVQQCSLQGSRASAAAAAARPGLHPGGAMAAAPPQQQQQQQQQQPQRGPPLTVEQRMALLGEKPLPATKEGSAAYPPPPPPPQRAALGAVAASDQARLAAALGGSFVSASVQDMGDEYQRAQQAAAGLRHPKREAAAAAAAAAAGVQLQPWGGSGGSSGGVRILDDSAAGAAAPPALAGTTTPASSAAQVAAAAAAVAATAAQLPVRSFEDWRPAPLLCKRFNVPDPYKGRRAPLELPKFKSEYVALPDTAAEAAAEEQRRAAEWAQEHARALEAHAPPAALQHTVTQPPPAQGQVQEFVPDDTSSFLDSVMQELPAPQISGPSAAAPLQQPQSGEPLHQEQDALKRTPAHQQQQQQQQQQEPRPGPLDGAEPAQDEDEDAGPLLERPLDLFRAIFEDSEEEEEEQQQQQEEEQQKQEQQQQQTIQLPTHHPEQLAGQQDMRQGMNAVGQAAKGLADAFARRGAAARPAAAAGAVAAALDGPRPGTAAPQGGSSQKQAILEALEALRSKKKSSKKKHKKDSSHSKKSRKEKKEKDKEKGGKSSRSKHRRERRSSGHGGGRHRHSDSRGNGSSGSSSSDSGSSSD